MISLVDGIAPARAGMPRMPSLGLGGADGIEHRGAVGLLVDHSACRAADQIFRQVKPLGDSGILRRPTCSANVVSSETAPGSVGMRVSSLTETSPTDKVVRRTTNQGFLRVSLAGIG
jgi:hypothetical protein